MLSFVLSLFLRGITRWTFRWLGVVVSWSFSQETVGRVTSRQKCQVVLTRMFLYRYKKKRKEKSLQRHGFLAVAWCLPHRRARGIPLVTLRSARKRLRNCCFFMSKRSRCDEQLIVSWLLNVLQRSHAHRLHSPKSTLASSSSRLKCQQENAPAPRRDRKLCVA